MRCSKRRMPRTRSGLHWRRRFSMRAGRQRAWLERARRMTSRWRTIARRVLTAFQDVEDQLAASRQLSQQDELSRQASEAADETERLTLNQYRAGTVSYTNVVVAQTSALSARVALARVEVQQADHCDCADQSAGRQLGLRALNCRAAKRASAANSAGRLRGPPAANSAGRLRGATPAAAIVRSPTGAAILHS